MNLLYLPTQRKEDTKAREILDRPIFEFCCGEGVVASTSVELFKLKL